MAQKIKHSKYTTASYQGTKTLEVLEGANDYNTWIAESLLEYLSSPLLEIGAGTGNITKFFLTKKPLTVTDVDALLVTKLEKKFSHISQVHVAPLDISKKPPQKYLKKFSSIVAVNVLEHIEDDVAALKNIRLMLEDQGSLVLLVPAKKFAFTRLDRSLGHFRRYEKDELQKKITKAGLAIKQIYFFNFLGLFTWIIRDKISQTHTHISPTHIALFDKIVYILKVIEKYIPIPIGISLIVVATHE